MHLLYNLVIHLYSFSISTSAFFGNKKARKWVDGRKNWENALSKKLSDAPQNRIWFHCASLGEFEQGRALLEKLKKSDPSLYIVLTFFSPSGFEVRRNYSFANYVCYLPADTFSNANKFISLLSPKYIVFIKYEFWYNYFNEANKKEIPLYIASAIFRPTQLFFKWYGRFFRKILNKVNFFFLQDNNSGKLLSGLGINNYCVTGDTRFDRVNEIAQESISIDVLETFTINNPILVAGSTWPEDENILLEALSKTEIQNLKLIIAPHEVNETRVHGIVNLLSTYFKPAEIKRFSEIRKEQNAKVLVLDTIGLLSSIYKYATIAWIGGGFGKGIHNILEAAAFGKPTLFGPNYGKFKEARDLVDHGGSFSINNASEANEILQMFLTDKSRLQKASESSLQYVKSNVGATEKIISHLKNNSQSTEIS